MKKFFHNLIARPNIQAPQEPEPVNLLDQDQVNDTVGKLNIERIRRAMLLFDLKWDNGTGEFFSPNEDEIAAELSQLAADAINRSRATTGFCMIERRGFKATSYITPRKQEVLELSYILSSGSSLPC